MSVRPPCWRRPEYSEPAPHVLWESRCHGPGTASTRQFSLLISCLARLSSGVSRNSQLPFRRTMEACCACRSETGSETAHTQSSLLFFEIANGCIEQVVRGFVEKTDMRPPRHVAHEADTGVAQRRLIVRRFELGWVRTRFATPVRDSRDGYLHSGAGVVRVDMRHSADAALPTGTSTIRKKLAK